MKKLALLLLVACGSKNDAPKDAAMAPTAVLVADAAVADASADAALQSLTWSVRFSPKGGCQDEVIATIKGAKHSIAVAAYSFTAQPVADALIERKNNNVAVSVLLDRINAPSATGSGSAAQGSKGQYLKDAGIPVWIDRKHVIMHDKFIVVDNKIVETGSYNYTNEAETSNAENCLVEHNVSLAHAYTDNWLLHQQHSTAL